MNTITCRWEKGHRYYEAQVTDVRPLRLDICPNLGQEGYTFGQEHEGKG